MMYDKKTAQVMSVADTLPTVLLPVSCRKIPALQAGMKRGRYLKKNIESPPCERELHKTSPHYLVS